MKMCKSSMAVGSEGCRPQHAEDSTGVIQRAGVVTQEVGDTVELALAELAKRWAQCPLTRAPKLRHAESPIPEHAKVVQELLCR